MSSMYANTDCRIGLSRSERCVGFSIRDVAASAQQTITIAYLGDILRGALICKQLVVSAWCTFSNIHDTLSCALNRSTILAG